jgi:hypothetical protein
MWCRMGTVGGLITRLPQNPIFQSQVLADQNEFEWEVEESEGDTREGIELSVTLHASIFADAGA